MASLTPLHARHQQLGARIVDFAGWAMPLQYAGLESEHRAVRTAAGMFDVSHMGEIEFRGPGALAAANGLISNDLSQAKDGQALYAGLLNDAGGFVDDVVAYRITETHILVCVNAANVDKDFAWMHERAPANCKPANTSADFAQLAVQGPQAARIVGKLTPSKLDALGNYHFVRDTVAGVESIISRTGYTGEDGFELYCSPASATKLWDALLEEGAADGLVPAGLAARDTLRTEMKYALYGNDIDDAHSPLEAGLGWIVKFDKPAFIGREALIQQKATGVARRLVGFELVDTGIARPHYPLLHNGQKVGEVTSGTLSPTLARSIGMGYLPTALARDGNEFHVEIRGRKAAARVVKTPFYRRATP